MSWNSDVLAWVFGLETWEKFFHLSECGVIFETHKNTLGNWMIDRSKGTFQEDVKNERVMRGSVCFVASESKIPDILEAIERCAELSTSTIFSLGVAAAVEENGISPIIETLEKLGCKVFPNCKTSFILVPQKAAQEVGK